jgi:hypothetical protein
MTLDFTIILIKVSNFVRYFYCILISLKYLINLLNNYMLEFILSSFSNKIYSVNLKCSLFETTIQIFTHYIKFCFNLFIYLLMD